MTIDESNYKTMKLFKCRRCGNVYAASLAGSTECPDCSSDDVSHFCPDGDEGPKNGQPNANK
jgi:predicted Zn-ribbon and HTH transcriptional regulator